MLRYNCICWQTEKGGSGFPSAWSAAQAYVPSSLWWHPPGAPGVMLSHGLGLLVAELMCSDKGLLRAFEQCSRSVSWEGDEHWRLFLCPSVLKQWTKDCSCQNCTGVILKQGLFLERLPVVFTPEMLEDSWILLLFLFSGFDVCMFCICQPPLNLWSTITQLLGWHILCTHN